MGNKFPVEELFPYRNKFPLTPDSSVQYWHASFLCVPASAARSTCVRRYALARWGRTWKITFEPTKSHVMTISHRTRTPDFPPVSFNDTLVSETSQLHLLGVTFDHQLSFRTYLRAVSNRGRSRLHFLRKCAPILDPRGRERVYKGFVRALCWNTPPSCGWVRPPLIYSSLIRYNSLPWKSYTLRPGSLALLFAEMSQPRHICTGCNTFPETRHSE